MFSNTLLPKCAFLPIIRIVRPNLPITLKSLRNMSMAPKTIEESIAKKLSEQLDAKHLEVINESYMHNVPKGAETHFKVVIVSDKFDGLALIKRHRLVNDILKDELQNGVHALSITAKTNDQWEHSDKVIKPSPTCLGGFGK